jgi:hypothetical protein
LNHLVSSKYVNVPEGTNREARSAACLRNPFFWEVMLPHLNVPPSFFFKKKAVRSFETPGTHYPPNQGHIPVERNPKLNIFLEPVSVCRHLTPNVCLNCCNKHLTRRPKGCCLFVSQNSYDFLKQMVLRERNAELVTVTCRNKTAIARTNMAMRRITVNHVAGKSYNYYINVFL